jgi:hypothetical protein
MRGRLGWLIEDGFVETKTRVLPAQFQLEFLRYEWCYQHLCRPG